MVGRYNKNYMHSYTLKSEQIFLEILGNFGQNDVVLVKKVVKTDIF